MSEFSTYFENAIINLMRNTAFTQINAYVALFNTSADTSQLEAGTLTNEISGNGYARELAGLTAPSDGTSSNASEIAFTQATGSWGTVRYCALMDAVSGGNILMYTQLDADKTVDTGDTFKIAAGDLDVTVT